MIRWEGSRLPACRAGTFFDAIVLMTFAPQVLLADEAADPAHRATFHVTANYPLEAGDYVGYAGGFDILAGADIPIWRAMDLFGGPRIGWYSETVCTAYLSPRLAMHQKPSVGGQIYFTSPVRFLDGIVSTAGVSVCALINLDDLHSDPAERIYTFHGFFLGLRCPVAESLHPEARLGAGVFP